MKSSTFMLLTFLVISSIAIFNSLSLNKDMKSKQFGTRGNRPVSAGPNTGRDS